MASSQVEIASSSPFGCVLRDHNRRRDRCSRESNTRATFQKNLKDLVRNQLQSCISAPQINSDSDSNENSNRRRGNADCLIRKEQSNKRARDMVIPIDKQSHEVENSAPSNSESVSSFQRDNSPAGGVSSLVQRWRDFEAESKSLNSNPSPVCSTRSNSESIFTENASLVEVAQSVDERYETITMVNDTFGDWESDQTAPSGPPSSRGGDSDAAESERIRVADIIRKLTSVNRLQQGSDVDTSNVCELLATNESLHRVQMTPNQTEQSAFFPVICLPRIRGRQALDDLLVRMECDRNRELEGLVERKPVTRFSKRGRIQALLRVRLLRHGADLRDHRHSNPTISKSNRLAQGSTIKHLRERFSTGVDYGASDSRSPCREVVDKTPDLEKSSPTKQRIELVDNTLYAENSSASNRLGEKICHQEVTNSRSPCKQVVDNTPDVESSSTSNQLEEDIHHKDVNTTMKQSTPPDMENSSTSNQLKEPIHHKDVNTTVKLSTPRVQNSENLHDEASPDVVWQETNYEVRKFEPQQSEGTGISVNGWKEYRNAKEQKANNQHLIGPSHVWMNDISHPQLDWEEQESNDRQLIKTDLEWMSDDVSHSWCEWEEQQSNDWISDIARPRSDWEGLRQARYQEMLDPYLDNGDIRQLLERRSVSSFLSSGLRESIDRLMMSRSQREPHLGGSQVKEEQVVEERREKEDEEEEEEEKDGEDVGDDDDDDDEEEEDNRPISEVGEYFDQTTSSLHPPSQSLSRSWRSNRDHEVSDDSDQIASPSWQQSISSNSYSQDNQQCDMELIYDLRGHMEQLHQEMSEIRKSVKSCINMQVKLQRSIKQGVAAAMSHSVRREGKKSHSRVPRKGSCCICCEMPVDSLLYRCGHMCTCFKCAHELQRSSGECPICRAPILDVVRAQH